MIKKKQSASAAPTWRLTANIATLRTSSLCGQINLLNPLQGLHQLSYGAKGIEGSVLGVATGEGLVGEDASVGEIFVRGNDLVVAYRETNDRPFSLQVYWTVTPQKNGVVLIDTLLSLETQLLESFPRVLVKSELACDEIWNVSGQTRSILLSNDSQHRGHDCLVLRGIDETWSYAEMAHPEDPDDWQLNHSAQGSSTQNNWVVQRELGGAFQEKGVVHRMRLRGAFLPLQEDLQLAAKCLANLAAEAPPLTA